MKVHKGTRLEVLKVFQKKPAEYLERILTNEGCKLRMNRSIQAEGSFVNIKGDMLFRRYLCRGQKNVLAESILLAMAHNINKLDHKIQNGSTGTYFFEMKKEL
uniref:transposase n=1 Tax=Cellulosilyticum ruminicola TaxID=425254 RepID=UPI0006CF3137|nr:transposase [Cellulosilyticum ruminicola]